jgi:4-amino-4-deoxy-L-arabinose transferase-like glycosyltransferase
MTRSDWLVLLAVLLVALALRLAAGWAWQAKLDGRFGFGDSESYWTLARAVARGEPYQYGSPDAKAFRTPGYPILLAPLFWLDRAPPVLLARAEGAVLGTLAVAGVWWLGRLLFDSRTGILAGCASAVYPGAVATSALVLSEAAFTPLLVAQIGLWTLAARAGSVWRSVGLALAAGGVAGAATLVRPSWLLFTPAAAVLAVAACRPRKRHLAVAAGLLLGLVLVMAPWWVRNGCVFERFVPTTLQVGASLYDGLGPQADGGSNMDFVAEFVRAEREEPTGAGGDPGDPFEVRLDRRLRAAALASAREDPGRVLRLAGVKLVRMWNVWPNEASLSSWPIRLGVACTYVPVLVLAVAGGWQTVRRGWPYVLCWLPAVYFTLLHVVFVSSIRYRQPAMLPLVVLAAGAVMAWWQKAVAGDGR